MSIYIKNCLSNVFLALMALCLTPLLAQGKYVLDQTTSEVHFISKTENETIAARNGKIEGHLVVASADLNFKVPIVGFEFQKDLMRKRFNETYMESGKFPYATFEGTLEGDFNLLQNGTYTASVSGHLEMHGIRRALKTPLKLKVQNGVVQITGAFKILLSDYAIELPILATVLNKISEEIEISVKGNFTKI